MRLHKILILVVCSFFLNITLYAQEFQWSRKASLAYDSYGFKKGFSVTDSRGNVYVYGHFFNTAVFGKLVLTSAGSSDLYLAKYDSKGSLIWIKRSGGLYHDISMGLTIDSKDNVYICGFSGAAISFGNGIILSGENLNFLAKYDTAGNIAWAKNLFNEGQLHNFTGNILVCDKNTDGLYLCGMFRQKQLAIGGTTLYSPNSTYLVNCYFISKIDKDGIIQWAKRYAYSIHYYGSQYYHELVPTIDPTGKIYVTGYFTTHLQIGETTFWSPYIKKDQYGSYIRSGTSVIVANISNNGDIKWAKDFPANTFNNHYQYLPGVICADKNNIYIAGAFTDTLSFPNSQFVAKGKVNGFLARLDSSGNFYWAKHLKSEFENFPVSLNALDSGKVALTGNYVFQADFGTASLYNDNGQNCYFLVADTSGKILSLKEPVVTQGKARVYSSAKSINNAHYLTGLFQGYIINGKDTIIGDEDHDLFVTYIGDCQLNPKLQASGNTNICYGDDVELSTKNDYTSYKWFIDGKLIKNATSYKLKATENGTYTVLADSGVCNGLSNSIYIDVSPKPDLGEDKEICIGTNITLDPGEFEEYLWSNGSTARTIKVNADGTYYVKVKHKKGCISSDTVQVTILAPPKPEIIANPKTNICPGDTITLRLTLPYAEHQWFRNGQLMFGNTTDKIKVVDTGHYMVKVRNADGCYNSSTIQIKQTQLTSPSVSASGPLNFCEGGNVTLLVSSGYNSYQWYKDGSIINNEKSALLKINKSGKYHVLLDSGGCKIASQSVIVNVYPLPAKNLSDSIADCTGNSVELDAGSGDIYEWSTGENTQKIKVTKSGTYIVHVKNAFGCGNSDTFNVLIRGEKQPELIYRNDTLFAPPGQFFQWYFNGIRINGATEYFYVPLYDGNYYVAVTDEFGCTYSSTDKYIEKEISFKPGEPVEMKIYPNPTSKDVIIQFYFGPNVTVNANIALHDALGKTILQSSETLNSNFSQKIILNMSTLNEGVYFLSVKLNDFSTVRKIVKIKAE